MRVAEAAAALNVHTNTIRNWVAVGRLSDVRPAGARQIRLDAAEVEAMRAERTPRVEGGTARFSLTIPAGVERIVVDILRVPE